MTSAPPPSASTPKAAILAIILVSYVMIVLDISNVLTGLSKMHAELGFTDADLVWVSSAYTLAFGGLLLLADHAPGAHLAKAFSRQCDQEREILEEVTQWLGQVPDETLCDHFSTDRARISGEASQLASSAI